MCAAEIATILITGINGINDIRKREIFFLPTVLAGIAGMLYSISCGADLLKILGGLLPGLVVLALAILLNGQMGLGDAVVVMALGTWRDMTAVFIILISGLMAAAVVGGIYLMKGRHKKELPFIIFLFIGSLVEILI